MSASYNIAKRYERSTQASPNLSLSFAGRELPAKGLDAQSRSQNETAKADRPSAASSGTEREAARESRKKAHSADKLAQMTIEGDMRLHDLIIAGRADMAVLR